MGFSPTPRPACIRAGFAGVPRNEVHLVPTPRQHKGAAVIDVTCGDGKRRTVTLGPWRSAEAKAAHKRFLAEFAAGVYDRPTRPDVTVNEILLAHLRFAETHYRRPDGTQTGEVAEYKTVAKVVRELYGSDPAREVGPLQLKAVREVMIGRGWCRTLINQRVGKLRRVFKWAAGEELIPPEVYQRLAVVSGLRKGRSNVREREPVGPVDDAAVDATLPYLTRYVRGLVGFQRLTGCRPGEACLIRRRDIDTGGAVWLYRPDQHKTAWRGKPRVIAIGPKAQAVIREFFTPDIDAYLFSPRREREERYAALRAGRRTKVQPSQQTRRKRNPKKLPRERYTTHSYQGAVYRAVEKANADLAEKAKTAGREFTPLPHWTVNQLRHTFATKVRKAHGLEAAQTMLGHARADVTQLYAEKNEQLAAEIAAKLG